MNLIICPECGSRISDQEKDCPVCGYPLNKNVYYQFAPMQDNRDMKKEEAAQKELSSLSTSALILGILGVVFSFLFFGIIFDIIAIIFGCIGIAKKRKNGSAIGGLCTGIAGVLIVIILLLVPSSTTENKTSPEENNNYVSENNTEDTTVTEPEKESTETESEVKPEDVAIEEQTLYDSNGVTIKATSLEKDYFGYTVNIYIENNSDLNLGFNAHAYAVNGMMTGDSIYAMDCDVAAGKKANTSLDIGSSFMKENEIEVIRNIQILFWAYDNDASYKEFDTGQLSISTTADDGSYNVVTGQNIYDDGSISVDYLYRDGDKFYYCLTNNTDNYFNFDVNNISINDYTVSDIDYDLYDEVILKGCQKIFVIKVENSFKNLNGITDVSKIDFNFGIRPEGNYFKEYASGMIEQEIPAE